MPSGSFAHTVLIAAPASAVWEALQEAETWRGIGPIEEVWGAEHADDGSLLSYRWSADAAGRRWEGTAARVAATPVATMAMRLETKEMRGTITTLLDPVGATTELTVTLVAEAVGLLASVFWGVIKQAIGSGLPDQVEAFGRRLG